MKRYLYILLGVLTMVACEPIEVKPEVTYHIGEIATETTETSATITTDIPYMLVDGVKDESAVFYLRYAELQSGMSYGDEITLEEYTAEGGKAIFIIEDLQPATTYRGSLWLSGKHGLYTSDSFTFTTKEHIPVCEISCDSQVEAKGIMATILLNNIAYIVDGQSVAIDSVRVEYTHASSDKWTGVDATDRDSITIPADGGDYLEENSQYRYRITITPEDSNFEAMTTEIKEFKTIYAEITANIAKPNLAIDGDMLNAKVESIKVYYDGIERNDDCDYYIYYRKAGSADWSTKIKVEQRAEGVALDIALSTLNEGTKYEFCGAIIAGAEQKVCYSEVATITTPKTEEPTPDPPQTPPVGGTADTTAIAGIWHLTQWRDTTPSFDVYLNISEDGVVTLLQRITSREWELFYSTVEYDGNTILGTYTDGVAWSASYDVTISGDEMRWTNTQDATDVSVYTRSEWPAVQSSHSVAKSISGERFL